MNIIYIIILTLLTQVGWAQQGQSNFKPSDHGFNFNNTFHNDFVKELDWRTNGLCGGMVYTALDYYIAGKSIPQQNFRPAVHTKLHDYIYDRQVHSIADNIDKWTELGINPLGARNSEFFKWGLQDYNGGRLQELREFLDKGQPVPLGLWHADGHSGGDHQVLAIGYKMGRYRGDLGDYKEDLSIYVYDPNSNNEIRTLKADPRSETYFYQEDNTMRWLTYFVDKKYRPKNPPSIADTTHNHDGKVRQLRLVIGTGDDDLRGGNDNLNIEVGLYGKTNQTFNNVNKSRRWIDHYTQTIELNLNQPVDRSDISFIKLTTTFSGGIGGDNWKVDYLKIAVIENAKEITLKEFSGTPWREFKGDKRTQQIDINYRSATHVNSAIPAISLIGNQTCQNSIQGKIAWNYSGNKSWDKSNLDKLCGKHNNTVQPGKCFNTIMHGKVNWGGGTQWKWENALNLCQSTLNANRTVACFKKRVKNGNNWSSAIAACKR